MILASPLETKAAEFAALNGWNLSGSFFLRHLAGPPKTRWEPTTWPMLDHLRWFAIGRKPIAIVTQPHPFVTLHDVQGLAGCYGLTAVESPREFASWHLPGRCRFIVIVPRGVEVRWLPEQELP